MADIAECPVREPYDFEIAPDRRGHWVARDKDGLIGGVFRTRKDAVRFALFEVGGDRARVHVVTADSAE
jgi:hypothetical protein